MKERIATDGAPAAIGPYSQAIRAGNLVFLSGQIALHPTTGEIVGESAADQTRQVMANLSAVLKACGATFDNLVKTTIYLADLGDYADVNDVYSSYFDREPPARAAVEVARLPRDVRVEIDGIAVLGDG